MESNNSLNTRSTITLKKRVLNVLLITTVADMITLLALIAYWHISRLQKMAPQESEICFPTHKFFMVTHESSHRLCPVGLKELLSNRTGKTKSCCGPMSFVLKEVVGKIVPNKYDSDAAPEMAALDIKAFNCFKNKTAPRKAHLVGLTSDKLPGQTNQNSSIMFWNTGHPSFIDSGMKYLVENGTILIEKTGYFHISSQLRSKIQYTNCTDVVLCNNFKHFIHRISKVKDRQVLLEGEKSFCKIASDVSEFTSTIGAVFKLYTGDQLYVSTSHPSSVLSDLSDNYFSIYSV